MPKIETMISAEGKAVKLGLDKRKILELTLFADQIYHLDYIDKYLMDVVMMI